MAIQLIPYNQKFKFIPWTDNAYDISEYWKVRSYYKNVYNPINKKHEYIIVNKPQLFLTRQDIRGKKKVSLRTNKWRTTLDIWLCVYRLFVDNIIGRYIVWYKDWDRNNLHYTNLYPITWSENMIPVNRNTSSLDEDNVRKFRSDFNIFIKDCMKKYNLTRYQLKNIQTIKSWNI